MFNVVTGQEGEANAVLVRALEPTEGFDVVRERRAGRHKNEWTNGPAKLAQSLAITGDLNGACLFADDSVIWVEESRVLQEREIQTGPRIGLGKTPEPWLSVPWRYWIKNNAYVSR